MSIFRAGTGRLHAAFKINGRTRDEHGEERNVAGAFSVSPFLYQVDRERQAEQEQPDVEVERVGENVEMRIVKPAARQARPDALPQDLQRLRTHAPSGRGNRAASPSFHNVLSARRSCPRSRTVPSAAPRHGRTRDVLRDDVASYFVFPLNRWIWRTHDSVGGHRTTTDTPGPRSPEQWKKRASFFTATPSTTHLREASLAHSSQETVYRRVVTAGKANFCITDNNKVCRQLMILVTVGKAAYVLINI